MSVEYINGIPLPDSENYRSSNLPPLNNPPEFLLSDGWYGIDIKNDFLNFAKPYEKPPHTLSFNGIPFAPLGGIHAQTGLSGNGKTQTLCQYIAAFLKGEYGGLRYELADIVPYPKVLYIDTEMEECNTIAVKNRVCTMIGRDPQQQQDDFKILMLRETESAKDRWRKTLQAIFEVRPTVVFVDGLLDVIDDFNKNEDCQKLIYKCMQTASHYKISVWCLVHLNPNGQKLVGHLGSMLERKVTDLFCTTKDSSKGETIFSVTHKKARGRDVPEWKFRVLPIDGWGRPEQINIISSGEIPIEDIQKWLEAGRNDVQWPCFETTIKNEIFKVYGNIGAKDTLQACVVRAKNRRFIIEQPKEEWAANQRYPKYYLNID